jgi:hypothetical protein
VRWTREGRHHAIPAIVHRTWRAPDGRLALVASNWTAETLSFEVDDPRFTDGCTWIVASDLISSIGVAPGRATLSLPAFGCGLFLVDEA